MDSRLFFVFGDLVANIAVGLIAGWLCALVVGTSWNMLPAMLVAMAVGMVVGFVLFFPFGIFFGAMEVMLPIMFSGMLAGMVVGMWAAMAPVSDGAAALTGAICGVIGILVIWIANTALRGVRVLDEED